MEHDPGDDGALRQIEQRVLWLATSIVHHANRVRPNPGGLKVGGHQASSVPSRWLIACSTGEACGFTDTRSSGRRCANHSAVITVTSDALDA